MSKRKRIETNIPYEKRDDIKKLHLYITIVNFGQSASIISILSQLGSNAQFVQIGRGTAGKQIREILGIEDNRKEIIFSIVSENMIEDVKKELNAFFVASRHNKGIGFSIPMTSIIGIQIYKFLSNSL